MARSWRSWDKIDSRQNPFHALYSPRPQSQDRARVGTPHGYGAFGRDVPVDDPAVGIAGEETVVGVVEVHSVDLGRMAAEDIGWLGWRMGLDGWSRHCSEITIQISYLGVMSCYLIEKSCIVARFDSVRPCAVDIP